MNDITSGICWDGVYCNFLVYALFNDVPPDIPNFPVFMLGPHKPIQHIILEDELNLIGNKSLVLYDIVSETMPDDLEHFLRSCGEAVENAGAIAHWFGFEGPFSFEQLLAEEEEEANRVYCIGRPGRFECALDDEHLASPAWRATIASFREELGVRDATG